MNNKYLQLHNLNVRFRHIIKNGLTECIAYSGDNEPEIGARARVSKNDQYDRKKGRKVSLTRLLNDVLKVDRQDRFYIWESYRTTGVAIPRWPKSELGSKRKKKEERRAKKLKSLQTDGVG